MHFGSSGSVSRNQICCIFKQEHSLPYCDEGDESIFYLTPSDKREDGKNVCWYNTYWERKTNLKVVCLSNQYLWQLKPPTPTHLLLPFYIY